MDGCKKFYETWMGLEALTRTRGEKYMPYTINQSIEIIGHDHGLKTQHKTFIGDIWPQVDMGTIMRCRMVMMGLNISTMVKGGK